jgi:hypothetical protein
MPPRQRLLLQLEDEESVNEGDGDTPPPPPFNMPNMAQFWANATQFMTTMMAAMTLQGDHNDKVDCS